MSKAFYGETNLFSSEVKYFKVVYEQKGINHAARKMSQDSGNISRIIKRFEMMAGTPLFVRHKQGLIPTHAGDCFYRAICKAQEEFRHSIDDRAFKQNVRIGISPSVAYTYFSSEIVDALLNLKLHPEFFLNSTIEIIEKLKLREIDFAILPSAINFPNLINKPVASEHIVLCGVAGQQKTLLTHASMLGVDRLLDSITYAERWMINDYFVLSKLLLSNPSLMGILPESIVKNHVKLKILKRYPKANKITAVSWPGSVGVSLLRLFSGNFTMSLK